MNHPMHTLSHLFQKAVHYHHAGRHGGGGFGFGFGFNPDHGFGGDPRGSGGMPRGRKLSSADLQLLLLALLAEKPSHGYELIKALDERSNGFYSPSPGMVYPALTYIEEIGYATVEVQGAKKLYTITEAGLTHLEQNRTAVDALLEQMAWIGRRMDDVRRAMSGSEPADDAADFDAPDAFGGRGRGRHAFGAPELRQARRNLKTAVIEKSGASLDEQRRIAAILERAAAEIRAE